MKLDEFSLAFSCKGKLPLHFTVFRQVCVDKGHEGNIEAWFSAIKSLSTPNSHPNTPAKFASIAINKQVFEPDASAIKRKYKEPKAKENDESSDDNCD